MLKALAVLAAGVVAGALFIVLRPEGGDDAAPATMPRTDATRAETTTAATNEETPTVAAPQLTRINIEVRNGRPVGGVARVEVDQGRRIQLVVHSDTADRVHVHGHDLFADVAPGEPARIGFRATIPGRIEVELRTRTR